MSRTYIDSETGFHVIEVPANQVLNEVWGSEGLEDYSIKSEIIEWLRRFLDTKTVKEVWYRPMMLEEIVRFGFKDPDKAALFKLAYG